MTSPPPKILRWLDNHGSASPCAKSKRSVVIFDPLTLHVAGVGFNSPPDPFTCDGSDACKRDCSKICVHAEQAAIIDALHETQLLGLELVHGKFVDGKLVAGGGPSCWQCSKLILQCELNGVWLYEDELIVRAARDGIDIGAAASSKVAWRFYTALEFHQATLDAQPLYRVRT